jgi:hypothetical protein
MVWQVSGYAVRHRRGELIGRLDRTSAPGRDRHRGADLLAPGDPVRLAQLLHAAQIVPSHGGTIEVDSIDGATTVRCRLPR